MIKKGTVFFIALLLGAVLFSNIVLGPLVLEIFIPSSGSIKTMDATVEWYVNGTEATSINWGQGVVENGTAYLLPDLLKVTSTSNVPTTLSLNTTNHSPNIISLTLTWNYTDTTLQPLDFVVVQLNQTVTASSPNFSYDTVIAATEV